MVAKSFAPIIAGSGGVLLEAPDTLPESGTLALAVDAAGKMSAIAFPETTRASLGLATTDNVEFSAGTFGGRVTTYFGQFHGSAAASGVYLGINGTDLYSLSASGFRVPTAIEFSTGVYTSGDLFLRRDAAGTLALRNSTNGQKSRIYKTYTSATSGEWLELDAATDASNFDIAACIGSAGGTARGIRIGGKNAAGTFTSWMSFSTAGAATFSGNVDLSTESASLTCGRYGGARLVSQNGDLSIHSGGNRTHIIGSNAGGIAMTSNQRISFSNGTGDAYFNHDARIVRNTTAQLDIRADSGLRIRNLANTADAPISASNALFYKVNTSATSYEALQIDATGDASNFDIAASIGSAGGTARGIRIGGKDAAGTFTSWLSFSTAGTITAGALEVVVVGGAAGSLNNFGSSMLGLGLRASNSINWNSLSNSYSSGSVDVRLIRNSTTQLGLLADTGLAVRNLANSADAPITASNATFNTGTITTSQPLSLSQTWNNAATTFTGLQVNATDTASNSGSSLIDLQVGGVSRFKVNKRNYATFSDNSQGGARVSISGFAGNSLQIGIGNDLTAGGVQWTGVRLDNFGGPFWLSNGGTNSVGMSPASGAVVWCNPAASPTADLFLCRDTANTLAQRNGTTGQKSRLYKTYTSATSGEWLELDAATDASNFDIAASIGSAGGTARGIRIGGKNAAGTFTSWLSFATNGVATFSSVVVAAGYRALSGDGYYITGHGGLIGGGADGVLQLVNYNANGLSRLQLGGSTSSFPALKRNATAINFRLADDSADAPITAGAATFSGATATGVVTTLQTTDNSTTNPILRCNNSSGVQLFAITAQGRHVGPYWVSPLNGAIFGWEAGLGVGTLQGYGVHINITGTIGAAKFILNGGGTPSASMPGLFASGSTLKVRTATDSADAPITASNALFYKVNTSATSYEALQLDVTGDASNFDIASTIGSAGGTARGIRIGGKNAAGTFTPWMRFATNGDITWMGSGGLANIDGTSFNIRLNNGLSAARFSPQGFWVFNAGGQGIILGDNYDLHIRRSAAGTVAITTDGSTAYASLMAGNITASGTINPRSGTATAGTAPIKLTAGTNLTTPEAGAIEYDGTNLYFTDSGGTRRQLAVV